MDNTRESVRESDDSENKCQQASALSVKESLPMVCDKENQPVITGAGNNAETITSKTKLSVAENNRTVCEVQVICGRIEKKTRLGVYQLKDFQIISQVGFGKYGRVYRAMDLQQRQTVALKLIDLDSERRSSPSKQVQREIVIHGNILHPNIIQLFGFFVDNDVLHLVLEYAERGSLFERLQRVGVMDEVFVAQCIESITRSVKHLHKHGVMHRDIKPENILLDINDKPKLADFGWSVLSPKERQKTLCGTLDYLAPEMINGSGYDHRVDVWSLGVLTYELLFGVPPFLTDTFAETTRRIRRNDFSFPFYPVVTQHAKDFIQSILVKDPEDRLTIDAMLSHPFVLQGSKREVNE